MACTIQGHKTFLVVCNVGLLFTGLAILILGMKMRDVMSIIMFDQIPAVLRAVNAVIATGFFIALTGGTGISGACYEVLWLMAAHLGGLIFIIVMEFAIGVTLITVKNMIEDFMLDPECNNLCRVTLQTVILDLAMISAIIMMSIIILQALMVYSASQLFFHFKDNSKDLVASSTSEVNQHGTMQNAAGSSQTSQLPHVIYAPSHPGYRLPYPSHPAYAAQPHLGYSLVNQNRAFPVLDDLYSDPPPYSEVEHQASMMYVPGIQRNSAETTRPRNVSSATENVSAEY